MAFNIVAKKILKWVARFSIFFTIFYGILNGPFSTATHDFILEVITLSLFALVFTAICSFLVRKDGFSKTIIKICWIIFIPSFILEGLIIALLGFSGAGGEAGVAAFPLLIPLFLSFNTLFIFLSYRKESWGLVWLIYGLVFFIIQILQLYQNPSSRIYGESFYSYGLYILSGFLFLISYFMEKKPKIVSIIIIAMILLGGIYFYVCNKTYYSIMTNQTFSSGWDLYNLGQSLTDTRNKLMVTDYNNFFRCKLDDACRTNSLAAYKKDLAEFKIFIDKYNGIVQKAKVQPDVKKFNDDLIAREYDLSLKLYDNYLVPLDSAYIEHNKAFINYDKALKNNDLTLLRQYSQEQKELQDKENALIAGLYDFYKQNKVDLEQGFDSIKCELNVDLKTCLKQ